MKSRREALRSLAVGALVPALSAQHSHPGEPLLQIAVPPAPKNMPAEDFKLLGQLVDVIIPPTDTPGALAAGVPVFIDRAAGRLPATATALREGLASLRASGFQEATSEQRIALLQALEASSDPFFKLIKNFTIDGYYTSRDGLTKELGYHGNTFLTEFPGCTHPEHHAD